MDATRHYETTIIVNAGQARADLDGALKAVKDLYTGEGAEWVDFTHENLGERRLAYPIAGETSGLFLEGYFLADPAIVAAIERRARLSDLILRQLIIVREGKAFERIKDQRAKRAQRAAEAAAEE